ncbi:PREDICTED: general odorant-binding protein 72-like [Nicrophorus vespilloides]|uniref:General odorant-binding protein 72-like n=1 Tax=Nicrophorus vespilloides TaxID=110193 RepID=A0ABM1M8Y3_NICVS|nr:PREDICTED: general odorant-binding protein 72-like [Nicrophorus vespilloides]
MSEAQLKSTGKLARKNCQPKSKATDAQLNDLQVGKWDDAPETKCYAYCLMNMYKIVDKTTGKFNEETAYNLLDMLPTARVAPIKESISRCKGQDGGDDKCNSAYQVLKCIYFDNPSNYFAP